MTRHVRIAPRERTVRQVGLGPITFDAEFLGGYPEPAFAKGTGGFPFISTTAPPSEGLFIPAYLGSPDVGLTNPGILTNYTGGSPIPLGTYVNKRFQGQFVSFDSSTFDNCLFEPSSNHAILSRGGRMEFTDCEFGKIGAEADRLLYNSGGTYTLIRCNLHDAEDGAKFANGAIFQMCHVHDMQGAFPSPHYDCIQAEGTVNGGTAEFCNLDSRIRDGSGDGNAAMFIKADLGHMNDIVIHNNYLNGGNYTISLRTNGTPFNLVDTVVTDNIFGPDFNFGHRRVDSGTYAEWSGNVDSFGDPVTVG